MTLPDERLRAVNQTREFLRDLLSRKITPRVPKEIRERAYRLLKHYPWELYMDETAEKLPKIWGVKKP